MDNNQILLKIEGADRLFAYFTDGNSTWKVWWNPHDRELVWNCLDTEKIEESPVLDSLTFLKFGYHVPEIEIWGETLDELKYKFTLNCISSEKELLKDLHN